MVSDFTPTFGSSTTALPDAMTGDDDDFAMEASRASGSCLAHEGGIGLILIWATAVMNVTNSRWSKCWDLSASRLLKRTLRSESEISRVVTPTISRRKRRISCMDTVLSVLRSTFPNSSITSTSLCIRIRFRAIDILMITLSVALPDRILCSSVSGLCWRYVRNSTKSTVPLRLLSMSSKSFSSVSSDTTFTPILSELRTSFRRSSKVRTPLPPLVCWRKACFQLDARSPDCPLTKLTPFTETTFFIRRFRTRRSSSFILASSSASMQL
mmetsp:Transcript_79206/g.171223  ORF Transcript_79206/g.171223 Transcript_79206/m.171223 type:complete len:269 (+) Transcript_79206:254-1060(+)